MGRSLGLSDSNRRWHTGAVMLPEPALEWRVAVARRMSEELDDLVDRMMSDELINAPALGNDAAMAAEVKASNRANAEAILAVLARPTFSIDGAEVPAEALDVVRTVVRRGLDLEIVYQAYRRGQSVMWHDFITHAAEVVGPGQDLAGFLAHSSTLLFDYVDLVMAQVIATAQREREEILGGSLVRRIETVRLILDGAPVGREIGSERLGHDLRQWHTGLVLWSEPGRESHGVLESAALHLARSVRARPPLTVAAGVSALWAWIGTASAPDRSLLRGLAAELPPDISVAVGSTRPDVGGFRATHLEAIEVHGLLARQSGASVIALHEDYEVTLLSGGDVRAAADFVQRTLGGLAEESPTAARLRETVRLFLEEGGNAPRVAARLFTHRNTVLQRIERASALLGHRPEENRLSVALAVQLAHQLGPQVLTPSGT